MSSASDATPPRITPETALCGIVLHPAGHTRSPAMHNAAFSALGIDAAYLAFDVPPAALPGAVVGMQALGIRQLAVSIPHKVAIMELLDEVDATASRIGAVNTVTLVDGRLVGTNTDHYGVTAALSAKISLHGRRAVVLGAGGAARAAVFGLSESGAEVVVLNRTVSRARELAQSLGAAGAGALDDLVDTPHDVLVNTTSVGLRSDASPVAANALRSGSIVMDAVYDPLRTRLLADAEAAGARVVSGKWWLVHQAARQLTLWTGREAPIEEMARAFDSA